MTSTRARADQKADTHETAALISSAKIQGSNVYRLNGDRLGRIEHLMIDKVSGRIAYAVLATGSSSGQDFHPLPWSLLNFNERLGGYEFDVSDEHLKGAPKYASPEAWDWTDLKRGRRVHEYWRALPYWGF